MTRPSASLSLLGNERQPLVTFEDFAPDPDALRAAAGAAEFRPVDRFYPGVRAPAPTDYLRHQLPIIGEALCHVFQREGRLQLLGAGFSIVTTPPDALATPQRLPHCDAFIGDRVALVHYLSSADGDGTAFYRHRSTGFETIDEQRRPVYLERIGEELRADPPPPRYMNGDTALFERIAQVDGRFNRALLYPSFLLHSGSISPDAALSADPMTGRLTITAFLSFR